MLGKFSLWPDLASTYAWEVDANYIFIILVCFAVGMAVYIAIVTFAIKYRRRNDDEVPVQIEGHLPLEVTWSIVPLGIVMVMFAWGSKLFYDLSTPPPDALNFSVVGKQWMWKVQHPSGKREINELHIPIGQPVKMTITSEDVLHSFYIPAFRSKMDAVPGRYTTSWFEATKAGEFHIFCAEYCGLDHSRMIGRVVVMEPTDYERWLRNGSATAGAANETPEVAGARLFQEQRCQTCHQTNGLMAPVLNGVFGHEVKLQSGQTIVMDEGYIRESILNPTAKVVAGYQPLMPTYQGQVTEEAILHLIAYIKSLGTAAPATASPLSPGMANAATSEPAAPPPAPAGAPTSEMQSPPPAPEAPSVVESESHSHATDMPAEEHSAADPAPGEHQHAAPEGAVPSEDTPSHEGHAPPPSAPAGDEQ